MKEEGSRALMLLRYYSTPLWQKLFDNFRIYPNLIHDSIQEDLKNLSELDKSICTSMWYQVLDVGQRKTAEE